MREHTETIAPPRALWVSFPLGRPFGVPEDSHFQRRVLLATLGLLEADAGPVLAEFGEDIPQQEDAEAEGWACPVNFGAPPDADSDQQAALIRELRSLLPWYDRSRDRRGRTTVGASGCDPETALVFVVGFLDGFPESPRSDLSVEETFKQCVEDLRALYTEAATAEPGATSPESVQSWLWNETAFGRLLLELHQRFLHGPHAGLKSLAEHGLVPRVILESHGQVRPPRPDWHTPQ